MATAVQKDRQAIRVFPESQGTRVLFQSPSKSLGREARRGRLDSGDSLALKGLVVSKEHQEMTASWGLKETKECQESVDSRELLVSGEIKDQWDTLASKAWKVIGAALESLAFLACLGEV